MKEGRVRIVWPRLIRLTSHTDDNQSFSHSNGDMPIRKTQIFNKMSQFRLEKQDRDNSKSYKDLIKENARLNAEVRKLGRLSPRDQQESRQYSSQNSKNKDPRSESNQEERIRDKFLLNKLLGSGQVNQIDSATLPLGKDMSYLKSPSLRKHAESMKLSQSSTIIPKDPGTPMLIKSGMLSYDRKSLNARPYDDPLTKSLAVSNHAHYTEKKLEYKVFTPPKFDDVNWHEGLKNNKQGLLEWIRENIVGFNTTYTSQMQLPIETIYVDHTATNRPFRTVQIMVEYAKLFAANPHSEFSRFGKYSTEMMHYAHDSLLRSFNADPSKYVVLPTGSGSTGAIEKSVRILASLEDQKAKKPTVFLTPYEHHSNILPWVEFYDNIEILATDQDGTLLFDQILEDLRAFPDTSIIVSISAASNVTSKITDLRQMNQVIKVLRKEGKKKIIFAIDVAAFCCHHDLDLKIYDEVDLAYLSPHKNLGGAESCGVLLARKSAIENAKPTFPGGGTVRFVKGYKKNDVMYQVDAFAKEIAGTPAFFGFYRAALSFQLLKNAIGYDFIHMRERKNTELFVRMIDNANEQLRAEGKQMVIQLYGEKNLENRANVFTFNFELGEPVKFLQHSFASLIFTDMFGIQLRSGCFCAGPYGMKLLKLNYEKMMSIAQEVDAGILINKPGYLRLDLTFYLEDYEIEYIAKAIILIARYWENLQKLYTVCNDGEVILLACIAKKKEEELYSLSKFSEAFDKIRTENEDNKEKLRRRKETLANQLRVAEFVAKNPLEFIKKAKAGKIHEI